MICSKCGANVEDGSKFCVACGNQLEAPEAQTPEVPVVEEVPVAPVVEESPAPAAPPVAPVYYQSQPQKKEFTENDLPEQYRPLGAWSYFGLQLLFSIPIVGFVFLIVFSFSRGNLNRRSFARSYWCWWIIAGALIILMLILGVGLTGLMKEARFY